MDLMDAAKRGMGAVDTAIITVKDARPAGAAPSANPAALAGARLSGAAPSVPAPAAAEHAYKVQFNPSELVLDGARDVTTTASVESAEEGGSPATQSSLHTAPCLPHITLTLQLIFDEVNLYDAFMQEKFSPSPAALAKNAISAAAVSKINKVWTVKPIVEGFIGALRNPSTRAIRFTWGKFVFEGDLEFVRAEYTMFSTSGRPIRAKMQLRLVNRIKPETTDLWIADMQKAFAGNSSSQSGPLGKVANLINPGALGL
jgi:hypothetical protein